MNLRDRYNNDVEFHNFVNVMLGFFETYKYTPTEAREAVLLASILYEERHIREMKFIEPKVEHALRVIRNRLEQES